MNENTGTPISGTTRPDAENVVEPSKTIDLASIMFSQQKAKEEQKAEPVEEKQEPELSPLEKLRKSQEEHGLGMEITQGSFEEKTPTKEFRNPIDSDVRRENAEKAIAESDEKLTKRSAVVLIRQPGKNADSDAKASAEYAEAEIELDSLEFDANGKPYFNYFQEDAEGNKTPLTPKYFIIRTPEYGPYDPKTEKLYAEGKTPKEVQAILKADGTPTDTKEQPSGSEGSAESTSASVSTDGDETEEDARKKKIVQVLIDKTGYGTAPIEFTDEEKKEIYESEEILLTSVRKLDVKSLRINSKKDKEATDKVRSFQETARNHQLSDSHADVTFVCSGFHAQMTGMNYGELTDAAVDPDGIDFDRMNKQLTVVYNHMTNMSRPPFEDYDDFLKNFAYADLEMALYGLYVATMPSLQSLGLTCGRRDCQNRFNQNFHTRELIQFDRSTETYLNRFRKIINAAPTEYNTLLEECPLNNTTIIELPTSKYCVEFGPITLYDYLYKVLPIGDEQVFKATFGENPSMHVLENLESIPAVRQILVPDGEGGYDAYDSLKDLMDIMASVTTDEIKIIRSMTRYILADVAYVFGLKNIKCPKCGAPTEFVPVDVGTLVFQEHERLMNTTIDVTKWHLI